MIIIADEVCVAIHVDEHGNAERYEIFRLVRTVGTKDMKKNTYMTVKFLPSVRIRTIRERLSGDIEQIRAGASSREVF